MTSELFDDSSEEVEGCQRDIAAWKEKDARSLAAMSLHNLVTCNPHHSVTMGPGAAAAPRRWLGVMKCAHVYSFPTMVWAKRFGTSALFHNLQAILALGTPLDSLSQIQGAAWSM